MGGHEAPHQFRAITPPVRTQVDKRYDSCGSCDETNRDLRDTPPSDGGPDVIGKRTKDETTRTPEATPGALDSGMSLISKDMTVTGDCVTQGRVRIQGTIDGNVTATGLELQPSGSVKGDVSALEGTSGKEAFVIDGSVEGAVRARVVEVRASGSVHGGVFADDAIIHGRVSGGVLARTRLTLEETATVEGDVRARRLALKDGGQVNGTIRMGEQAAAELAEDGARPGATARKEAPGGEDDPATKGSPEARAPLAAGGPA